MKRWIKRLLLKRLLAKPVPERYKTSIPTSQQKGYDFISVHGKTRDHDDCLLRSINNKTEEIVYFWWDSDAGVNNAESATCDFDDVVWESLFVEHRFLTWEFKYGSLSEAYVHDLFHIPKLQWLRQRFRDRFLKPVRPNYRMTLLQYIVDDHSRGRPIHIEDLLQKIYGSAIRLSEDNYRHRKDLEFNHPSRGEGGCRAGCRGSPKMWVSRPGRPETSTLSARRCGI